MRRRQQFSTFLQSTINDVPEVQNQAIEMFLHGVTMKILARDKNKGGWYFFLTGGTDFGHPLQPPCSGI